MDVRCYHRWDELDVAPEQWNGLAGDVPFLRWEWLAAWWGHYGQEGQLYVVTVRQSNGRLLAVAPWYTRRALSGARLLHFLGSGKVCSDYLSILTAAAGELCHPAIDALAQWLRDAAGRRGPDRWDLMELDGAAAGDTVLRRLADRLQAHRVRVRAQPAGSCWRKTVGRAWEDDLQQLSKPFRRKIRQLSQRFLEPGLVRVRTAQTPAELGTMLDELIDLHQRRRNNLGQRGCFEFPRFQAFVRDAASRMFPSGLLQLVTLQWNQRSIAASLGFVLGGTHYVYQCGMDPEYKRLQPGWLMNLWHLEQARRHGYTAIDFLRGDERYKADLGCHRVPLVRWQFGSRSASGRVQYGWWRARDSLKGWCQR